MTKRDAPQAATPAKVFHLAAWALAAVCLAASLWLVLRSERRWAAAGKVDQSLQPPHKKETPSSSPNGDLLVDESAATAADAQATIDTPRSPNGPLMSEARSVVRTKQDRHRLGSERASVQMTMFFDYECPRCLQVEQQVRALMAKFPGDVSLSLRHYPESTDCNPALRSNAHRNACQAARAAETAAILKGETGFWEMHAWLFARMGRFSIDDLRDALPDLDYHDVGHFIETMNGEEPLELILRDVLDARTLPNIALGTMLMNGVQLESGEIDDALAQAVRFLEGQPPTDSLAAGPPQGPFSIELLNAAMAATVQVVNVVNGDQGSGVMIAKRGPVVYVLTADHLLAAKRRSADRGVGLEIRVFPAIAAPVPAVYRSVHVVDRAMDDDLAVLSFSTRQDIPEPLPICPLQRMPDDEPFPVLSVGWGGGVPTVVAGIASAKKRARKRFKTTATQMWELDKPSKPGQSGGPLIDPRGYVVGVASGNSGGHGYFCHTDLIHRLLYRNGLTSLYSEKAEATNVAEGAKTEQ